MFAGRHTATNGRADIVRRAELAGALSMFARPNATFSQVAYVTSDLDQAIALFRDDFNVPEFFVFANDAPGLEQEPKVALKIALANVGGVEIELIEPERGKASLFRDPLPEDGSFACCFHHVAFRITGPIANFEAHMASLDPARHPLACRGGLGDVMRFAYTDERATLGHYVEHVWFDTAMYEQMAGMIPHFPKG
jgi:Glyoxalase/Bleomycin resistance protein/Dioxygenase superfamily